MMQTLRYIALLLTPDERYQAFWYFIAVLFMAIIDVIGVASIMPFMFVITDPEALQHHAGLLWLYNRWHFTNINDFMICLGLLVLTALLISNIVTIIISWFVLRFSYLREYTLSKRLFTQYLYQPYAFFLNRHSSELTKNIIQGSYKAINHAFIPFVQMIAKL